MNKNQDDRNRRKHIKILTGIFIAIAVVVCTSIILIIAIGKGKETENINQSETLQQETVSGKEGKKDKDGATVEDDSAAEENRTADEGSTGENENNPTVTETAETKSTDSLNNADNSAEETTAKKIASETEKKNNNAIIPDHENTIGDNINAADNNTINDIINDVIINSWIFESSEVSTREPVQIKDPRCNLDVTGEFYKYELAYRTKDASALEGDDLIFYNNLKQALDNAYKYAEPWYQEKEIHDWIVLNATYDTVNYNNNTIPHISYTAYGIFVKKTAVCDGYSRAFQLCMDILGIENKRITGGNHAWNMVKLEGEWYHVDCTSDDPVPDTGKVGYDNFNVTDTMAQRNHTYEVTTPANGRKYSYYNYFYKGKVAHSLDEYYDELCKAINNNEKVLNIVHYDETSNTRMDYKSELIEYQDYIQVYNRTGRLVQSLVHCKMTGYNHRQLEIELYEDTSCTEIAVGKEDYEKKLSEHIAAGDKNIKMYILDEDYWKGKYIIGENKIIGGKAYIRDEEIRSASHWSVGWTDWNIVYYLTKELEYLESWDNCYYVSTMEEAKKIVKEHYNEDIRIYFETCNEEKINIKECIKGTAMEIWYELVEKYENEMGKNEKILENYTIVHLYGSIENIVNEAIGQ